MKFEVLETSKGRTRIVTTTRREQGAENEADRQVASTYENYGKHAERIGGWVCQGPSGKPNETVVAWGDPDGNVFLTYISYRRLGPDPEVEAADAALEDALAASLLALNGANL